MATWNDFNMTAQQRAVAAEYEALGDAPGPVVPTQTQTMQQAFRADQQVREFITLLGKAQRGAHRVMAYHLRENERLFREANQ